MAPSLVASPFATGAPESRSHSDKRQGRTCRADAAARCRPSPTKQIANVLTYVRRQWGNTATPVDVQVVKATRAAVAGRTRPWTNAELTALSGGAR